MTFDYMDDDREWTREELEAMDDVTLLLLAHRRGVLATTRQPGKLTRMLGQAVGARRLVSEDKTCHTGSMTNTDKFQTVRIIENADHATMCMVNWDGDIPLDVHDSAPEARGLVAEGDETPEPAQDLPEPASFVLVPFGTERYWEGWANPCGTQVVDGQRFQILATIRTGTTGASDAQFLIDRLASGLHRAMLQPRPEPHRTRRERPVVWSETPVTGRDMERMEAQEWGGEDIPS